MARQRALRVTKPSPPPSSSSRMTRRRSRLSSTGSSSGQLQEMAAEIVNQSTTTPPCDRAAEDTDRSTAQGKGKERIIEDRTSNIFPIMQLPTEIRLEIYRACLTRPKKILLSKVEGPSQAQSTIAWANEEDTNRADAQGSDGSTASRRAPRRHLRTRSSQHNRSSSSTLSSRSSSGSSTSPGSSVSTLASTHSVPMLTPITSLTSEGSEAQSPKQDSSTVPLSDDALIVSILRASKEIYKEARDVLYSENIFEIDLDNAIPSLAALHQRSRRHIKHIELSIPTYTDILESFSEVVRLSLRYCTGLKTLVIRTPFTLPGTDGAGSVGNATVYANGFDILRWLPQCCEVVLEGCHNPEIDAVVGKHLNLAKTQDKAKYAGRMFIVREDDCELKEDGTWVNRKDGYAVPSPVENTAVDSIGASNG